MRISVFRPGWRLTQVRVKSCAGCEFQGAEPTVAVIVRGIVVNSALVFKVLTVLV